MSRLLRTTLVLVVAQNASCALELKAPPPSQETVICVTDGDCGQGEVCEQSFCVVKTSVRELVAIQLTPSNDSDVLTEQFPLVELSQGDALPDLQFQEPKELRGDVTIPSPDQGPGSTQTIGAQMIFRRISPTIPGVSAFYQVDATRNRGYSLGLPSGTYDITVLPNDLNIPPNRFRPFPITAHTDYEFPLEGSNETTEVTGRLIFVDERIMESRVVPGAYVSAIDNENTRISTVSTTDESGVFTIRVRRDIETMRMVLDPQNSEFPLPRVITDNIVLGGTEITVGDLSIGVLHPIGRPVRGSLTGSVENQFLNTTIIFRGRVGEGFVVETTASDDEGNFNVSLPPGSYDVQIVPPSNSSHANTEVLDLRVPTSGPSGLAFEEIIVQPKTLLTGSAYSPDGNTPLPGATVLVRSTPLENTNPEGTRLFSVLSDSAGEFHVSVDPGVYDITLIPREKSGFARSFRYGVEIPAGGTIEELYAERPNLARGLVISPSGQPLPDVLVEIFRLDPEHGSVLIGSGLTGEAGTYKLLVPSLRIQ